MEVAFVLPSSSPLFLLVIPLCCSYYFADASKFVNILVYVFEGHRFLLSISVLLFRFLECWIVRTDGTASGVIPISRF